MCAGDRCLRPNVRILNPDFLGRQIGSLVQYDLLTDPFSLRGLLSIVKRAHYRCVMVNEPIVLDITEMISIFIECPINVTL